MSNIDVSEECMAHYQTVTDTKRPTATSLFARRRKLQTALHAGLFTAAFLFIAAVICGIFP